MGALPTDPRYRLALLCSPWGCASQMLGAGTATERLPCNRNKHLDQKRMNADLQTVQEFYKQLFVQ